MPFYLIHFSIIQLSPTIQFISFVYIILLLNYKFSRNVPIFLNDNEIFKYV